MLFEYCVDDDETPPMSTVEDARQMVMEGRMAHLESICEALARRVVSLERQLVSAHSAAAKVSSSGAGCFGMIDVQLDETDADVELSSQAARLQPELPGGVPIPVHKSAEPLTEDGVTLGGDAEGDDIIDEALRAAYVASGGGEDDDAAPADAEMDALREALNDSFADNASSSWSVACRHHIPFHYTTLHYITVHYII